MKKLFASIPVLLLLIIGLSGCNAIGEKNASLLRSERGLTMLEIATRCGFNNTANFNRAFKKYQNRTPSSYRKSSLIIP